MNSSSSVVTSAGCSEISFVNLHDNGWNKTYHNYNRVRRFIKHRILSEAAVEKCSEM